MTFQTPRDRDVWRKPRRTPFDGATPAIAGSSHRCYLPCLQGDLVVVEDQRGGVLVCQAGGGQDVEADGCGGLAQIGGVLAGADLQYDVDAGVGIGRCGESAAVAGEGGLRGLQLLGVETAQFFMLV